MSRSGGSTFKRCGCRDPRTGRQLGRRCPHLRERGHGSWYLAVELSAAPDGRRRRVRLGGYATRAAAQAALGRLGKPGGPPRRGVAGLHDRAMAGGLAGRPAVAEALDPPQLPAPPGHVPPPVHRQHPAGDADRRRSARDVHRDRPPPAARCHRRPWRGSAPRCGLALNAAIREGLISVNPARLVELPAPARPHPVVWTAPREAAWREAGERPAVAVWTAGQTARFLAAIRGEPLYPCYQLMAVSGLRRGEAAGLRWCDIDFAGTTLTVSRQQLPAGCDRYVFARPGGRPYPPGYLTRRFAKLVRREGLPPIRLHDLRHGAATLALAGGADLKAIQAMLGHASIILTADTYTSVLPDLARATAETVAAQILKAARTPPASPRPHPGLTRRRHVHPQGCVTAGQGPSVGRQGVEP